MSQCLFEYAKAISDLSRVIEINRRFAETYCTRADIYYHFEQYDAARYGNLWPVL